MTRTYLKYRTRIRVLACAIILSWAGLCVRLFQIQVLERKQYQSIVIKQAQRKQFLPANRGNIFDRQNRPLTRNIVHYTLSANPSRILDGIDLAKSISERTGKTPEYYLNKLNSNSNFVYLERNLQRQTFGGLETTSFEGLTIERKYRRYYPHNQVGAQILGFTDVDDDGISGIENDYNHFLTGTPGWVLKTKGWSGKIQHKSGLPFQMPTDGANIQLTIDLEYQSILEAELIQRQTETQAISATGIIMNPQTGEILAMTSTPGFDNNKYSNTPPDLHRVRAITDQFEPGSTFKMIPAVAALVHDKIDLSEEFNCENGEYKYYNITIRDHEKHGFLTLPQIIQYSSNIGVIKIMERLGATMLFETARNFGFGASTGISLGGELSGKLSSVKNWSAVSPGQIAMGHEVGITAIQLATAYCAVANGGYLVRPRLVRQIINHNEEIIYAEDPTIIRKIANETIMAQIREMLRNVVINGTGHNAEISGWEVAGKTGTAQKYINGKYSNKKFISNFVGFLPYENPQLLGFIMLDEPAMPYHWGAEGAAVAFNRILTRIINMDDNITPPEKKKKQPIEFAATEIEDDLIIYQKKPLGSPTSTSLPLGLNTVMPYSNKVEMPDLRGYSMRKAMTTIRKQGLEIKIEGSGKVVWQSPIPGTILNKGKVCIVGLK